jgi:hypothetical protein
MITAVSKWSYLWMKLLHGARVVFKNEADSPRNFSARRAAYRSLRAIAAALNERGIPAPRGTSKWQAGFGESIAGAPAGFALTSYTELSPTRFKGSWR